MRSSRLPNYRSMLRLAWPLSGAMASQALVNMIDTALVGNLGGLALAAVGIGSYLAFVLLALPVGLAVSIQGTLSFYAQSTPNTQHNARIKHKHRFNRLLTTSYGLIVCLTLLLVWVGYYASPWLINHFIVDDRLTGVAQHYFDWRLWALPAVAISLIIRCFWISKHQPWQYSKLLMLTHLLNVPISYALIYGVGPVQAFGPVGAGIGTCISIYIGLLLQLFGLRNTDHRLVLSDYKRTFIDAVMLLTSALPSSFQQLSLAIHLAVLLWLIGHLGISALAASFAVFNVGLLLLLPIVGLAQACSTLVAQCWQNKPKFAYLWSIKAVTSGFLIGVASCVLMFYGAEYVFAWVFINPDLIALASYALPLYAIALTFDSLSMIAARSLIATHRASQVMLLTMGALWLVLLPVTWWVITHYGFEGIWWWQLGFRMAFGVLLWSMWHRHFAARGLSL